MTNLAQESLGGGSNPQQFAPEAARLPVAGDLLSKLHEKYVGEYVKVNIPGYKGDCDWKGTLKDVVTNNGQLVLDFGDLLIPWNQVRSMRIAPKPAN